MPSSELDYRLEFRTPVSVFAGLGTAGLLDRTVMRTVEGFPYIPGSTVKGRLRFFAERLLRDGSLPGGIRLHSATRPPCRNPDSACTICRLFGNPALAALIAVRDALPAVNWRNLIRTSLQFNRNPLIHPDADIRAGNALSRVRRVTVPGHETFDEAVPALTFWGTILVDSQVIPEERRFLISVGALVDSIGARKAAGRGRLENGIEIREAGQ